MSDLFGALEQYRKVKDTNLPTRGTVRSVDGARVDVLVRGSSTIMRSVNAIGTVSAVGQEVVLTWENGIPTAHIIGGAARSSDLVSMSRGQAGAQGPQGATGSVSAAAEITLTELTETPALPDAGKLNIYAREDHKVYKQQSDGTVVELGAGAAGGSPVFPRLLTANLVLEDTECLVVSGYINDGGYDIILQGDAELRII